MRPSRVEEFRRNVKLETLLTEINGLLEPVEDEIVCDYRMPRYPVVLIVGAPRCGSTLLMQWLASTGCFGYPTNLLSRFYAAPYIGARIQQLLTDPEYSFRNELQEFSRDISFESDLGKTKGILAPNEFWYFWRRFIPNTEPRHLSKRELGQVDRHRFAAELAALEAVFDKPWAMKALILELNIPFLSSFLEKVLIVFVKRHPFYTIQSLLEARVRYFGDRKGWYSIKPRQYETLRDLPPIEQVAGQVWFTNHTIEEGLARIAPARQLTVSYEEFCADPASVFRLITDRFAQQGCPVDWNYSAPDRFRDTNEIRLSGEECQRVVAAYRRFSGREIAP